MIRRTLVFISFGLFIGLIVQSAEAAQASTLRLCTFDHPFPPYTMPDGSGQVQALLRQAATELSIALNNQTAPRQRCLEYLQSGQTDALVAAYAPERLKFGVYPMSQGQIDEMRALAVARFLVYRLRGQNVQWDGTRFAGLGKQTVGVQFGFSVTDALRQLGVAVDDSAMTTEQNLGKLALNRVGAVVAQEYEAQQLLEQHFGDQIEALPAPFQLTPLYLLVSRAYYAHHKGLVDAYWAAISKIRLSPAYRQYLRDHP